MTEERRKKFKKLIKERNLVEIRDEFGSINTLDPNGEAGEVDERLELLKGEISENELYEKHNAELLPILPDEAQWTRSYFNKQKVKLFRNFSKERFEHVREVGKFIFPLNNSQNVNGLTTENKDSSIDTKTKIIVGVGIVLVIAFAISMS